ncbi:glycosyltransferase [Dermacoccus nishinomiyaensis]|uniref:glycosyltransferase n=1 Tax=Dermacoccus nishinomiyaensis TaxID=1274 RepID=UPI0030CB9BA2
MESPRKTAIVSATIPTTIDRFHRELIRQLALTHEVHVVCSPGAALERLVQETGVIPHPIPMAREIAPASDARALISWLKVLRQVKPDVLVTTTPKASLLGHMSGAATRVPRRLYSCGGLRLEGDVGARRAILASMERITGRCATAVVVNSPSLAQRSRELRLFPRTRLTATVPGSSHGVDSDHFVPRARNTELLVELGLDPKQPVLGFVGRLTHDKGIDTLIAGMTELERRGVHVQLLVVGPQDEPDSQTYLERLRALACPVAVVGATQDVRPYFAAMDVHVLPSHREGFPNVVLEASAMRLPTVTTDATGCVDSVVDGTTGRVHAVGDVTGFADAVSDALEAKVRMGDAAREWVARDFAPTPVVASLLRPLRLETRGSVLHVINSLATGGAERLVAELVSGLRADGWHAELACLAPARGPAFDTATRAGVSPYVLGTHRFDPRAWWRLVRMAKSYSVVHSHLFPAFWAAALTSPMKVLTEHSTENSRRGVPGWAAAERVVYRRYRKLVAISEGVADSLRSYVPDKADDVVVIHNGIDVASFASEPGGRSQAFSLVTIAGLDARKRVDDAIRVVSNLPLVTLTIVGDGPDRGALEKMAAEIAPGRVTFAGLQSDVRPFVRDADVFLSTSAYEGFGIAALEAMSAGTPVVGPDLPGLREVVADTGILYPPGDLESARSALEDLMGDETKRAALASAAWDRAPMFSRENTVRLLSQLYTQAEESA